MSNLPYTRVDPELNEIITELMYDWDALVTKAKEHGLDIKYAPNSDHTLELYFHDDYPDTLLVDKEVSCRPYVRHGEWKNVISRYEHSGTVYGEKRCSVCGTMDAITKFTTEEWDNYHKDRWNPKTSNYCKGCGTKMDARELYEKYKRDWCESRGYKLEDMDEETGINGECYACFDEFMTCELAEMYCGGVA